MKQSRFPIQDRMAASIREVIKVAEAERNQLLNRLEKVRAGR